MRGEQILKTAKFLVINITIFVILLFVANVVAGLLLKDKKPGREELPNYSRNKDYAKEIFKDYRAVKHEYYPFVGWKTLPYNGKTTRINESGQRIHDRPPGLSAKTTVHFFGGSTMWGEGSDDNNTIPALFNRRFPEYQVHNHGQLAYNSRQELDALITLFSRTDSADVVIFYDGVNDAAFLCPSEIKELPGHRLVPMYREKIYTSTGKTALAIAQKAFVGNILLLIAKYKDKDDKLLYNCISDPAKAEEIADMMIRNWEIAHELVTRRGGRFIAILQPAAFVGNPKTDHLELDPELQKNFAYVYDRIKAKISQKKYTWIHDLSNAFDRQEHIFIDFCHVSPNGNDIMAKEIADIIADPSL